MLRRRGVRELFGEDWQEPAGVNAIGHGRRGAASGPRAA
jgi:hypothetical protein